MLKVLKTRPIYIALNLVLIVIVTLSISSCAKEEAEEKQVIRPVRTFQIPSPGQFLQQTFPGRAKATQEVDLAFRVSGPLITFPVDVGDTVIADDVVARIDPRDFEVNVQTAQGKLDSARAASRRADSEYQRELNILKQDPGATSQTAVDRKREQRDKEKANIKTFAAAVESAKDQLEYTYLKAPYDGIVVGKFVENFENVQAKAPIVRILDDSSIEMVVNIPESLISLAQHVEDVKVVFDPFPDTEIPAHIKEIGTEASATTRTYPVTLVMQQPEGIKILPGMAGKASGAPPKGRDGVKLGVEIPVSAVFTDETSEDTFVWVIDETSLTVSKKKIEVDQLGDRGIRIISGLKEGELIASAGVNYLFEGQKVKLLQTILE